MPLISLIKVIAPEVKSLNFGLYAKSSPVNYSYLSKLLAEYADILAVNLSKLYYASFCLICLSKILI